MTDPSITLSRLLRLFGLQINLMTIVLVYVSRVGLYVAMQAVLALAVSCASSKTTDESLTGTVSNSWRRSGI